MNWLSHIDKSKILVYWTKWFGQSNCIIFPGVTVHDEVKRRDSNGQNHLEKRFV